MPAQTTARAPTLQTSTQPDQAPAQGGGRQSRYGNAHIVDLLRAQGKLPAPEGGDAEAQADDPIGCIALKAFTQSDSLGIDDVAQGSVGHSWVAFQAYGDESDYCSWGFWPASTFSTDPAKDMPGKVNSPDPDDGGQRFVRRYPVTIDQLNDMYRFIEAHWTAPYNLYTFNCTDFAVGAVGAAGHTPPDSGVLGVDYPNALADGIHEENAAEGRDEFGVRRKQ